jgi:hypothetical protein
MTLTERSRALVVKIERASVLPLALRAAQAVVLVPETAALLVELSKAVERHEAEMIKMRGVLIDLDKNCARLPQEESVFDAFDA